MYDILCNEATSLWQLFHLCSHSTAVMVHENIDPCVHTHSTLLCSNMPSSVLLMF